MIVYHNNQAVESQCYFLDHSFAFGQSKLGVDFGMLKLHLLSLLDYLT